MRALLTIFLLTAIAAVQAQPKVTLDTYFNHEVHKTESGKTERFHYLWDEKDNNGFSILGNIFIKAGATLDTLGAAPTKANLAIHQWPFTRIVRE